jgi:hypothetical protein
LAVKLAVSKIGAFIVTEVELAVPVYDPVPLPVQLLKLYPPFGVAPIATTDPLSYHPPLGLQLPPVPAAIVKSYCMLKFAV